MRIPLMFIKILLRSSDFGKKFKKSWEIHFEVHQVSQMFQLLIVKPL